MILYEGVRLYNEELMCAVRVHDVCARAHTTVG